MAALKQHQVSQLQIHGVHALSDPNSAVIAACPTSEHLLAAAARSFAVVWDISTPAVPVQVQQLRSTTSNQPLQCLAWSCCGSHLAAGEAGSSAAVFVWDVSSGRCVRELKGHKSTVGNLCFSPDGKLLASIGCGSDGQLCVWDWHTGSLLCKQKVGADLSSVVFTEDSSHILAAGKATLKSWSLTWSSPHPGRRRSSSNGGAGSAESAGSGLSLTARQVNLKQQRSSSFVDMCLAPCLVGQPVGSNGVYALTDKGSLLLLRSTGRTVDRSINLQVQEAFALAATPKQVACACSKGVVRLFASKSLQFKANMPYWSPAGVADSSLFADARACTFGPGGQCDSILLVVYSNHEMIMWDIQDLAKVQPVRTFAVHTGGIWDLCSFIAPSTSLDMTGSDEGSPCCATCGTDCNIHFWDFGSVDDTLHPLCSVTAGLPSEGSSSYEQGSRKVQLRCMRISQDGTLLAVGDTGGNVHVYDVATFRLLVVQEAHDSEVLCLDFSPSAAPQAAADVLGDCSTAFKRTGSRNGKGLAVSGSRDTLIHVYDASHGFRLLETLDDHEAEVTAVRFTSGGRGLVSCGADHSIIFRVLGSSPGACSAFGYKPTHKETLQHTLLYDLAVDPMDAYVLTADQGGSMRMWDVATGSVLRSLQPEVGAGQVVRLCLDPGGVTAICCHSDGCIRMYDLETGHLRWRAWGHASHVAAAAVSPDLSRLVSVGGDGCVVVWKLPDSLTEQLQEAVAAVTAAKEQASCLPSPQQPPKLQAASPAAAGSSTSTPQGASHNAASIWTTPGSCMSDGAFSSTVRRLQQGKPLVSADKLPRWARSPTAATTAAVQHHASEGGAGEPQQQQQQQRVSKWLAGRPFPGADGLCTAAASDPGVQSTHAQAGACTESAGASASAQIQVQELQAAALWYRGHTRVLVTNWQDGSSFSNEAAAMATAAATAAAAASQLVASHEAPSQQDPCAAEQQADLPNKTQASPAGQGALVRDLFKSHFSSPQPAVPAHKAPEVADDDCLAAQQDRQSFSAKFKRERSSLSQMGSPIPDMATLVKSPDAASPAAAAAAADGCPSPCTTEPSTGLTPQGSKLFRAVSSMSAQPAPAAAAATAVPNNLAAGGASPAAAGRACKRPYSQAPSPREKRWRQGQMQPELEGMMEKLQGLQADFVQQQRQARSPIRPKSSLGHSSPTKQQLAANRRRSDSSAGSIPATAGERQGDHHQQQQQQAQQPLRPAQSPTTSHAAPAADARSPGRVTPIKQQAVGGKSSSRQPWASPSAVGSAKRPLKHTPLSSPPPSFEARRQQAAVGVKSPAPHCEAAGESPGYVFGSRTAARAQRRRSSATDDSAGHAPEPVEAANVAAAATAAGNKKGSSIPAAPTVTAVVAAPAVAAAGAAASPAPAAAAVQDNSKLLAALFGDDSPAPSPASTSPANTLCRSHDNNMSVDGAAPTPPGTAVAAAAAAGTPEAPNTRARLAALLDFDSSPEAPSAGPSRGSPPAAAGAATPGSRSATQSPTRRSLPKLEDILRQSSRSPSLSEPSDSSSPDRQLLRGPLASSCSPQQRQQGGGAGRLKPSGIPSLQGSSSSKKLLQLSGQLDASTECRVSIGTSIAARSPTRAAATSPLAQAQSLQQQTLPGADAGPSGAIAFGLVGAAAGAMDRPTSGCRSSVDLTPVPPGGLIYPAGDTPKVSMGGHLAAAGALGGLPAGGLQQQPAPALSAGLDGVASKAGVTITPAGNHQVWPAWGPDGAWEVTPSPGGEGLKKLWPMGAAQGPVVRAEQSTTNVPDDMAAGAGAAQANSSGLTGEESSASAAAAGDQGALLLASGSSYWVAQNPCYDMTPQGSAGRINKGLQGYFAQTDSEVALSDASAASSLPAQSFKGMGRCVGRRDTGSSAAESVAETGEPAAPGSTGAGTGVGGEDSLDTLGDGARFISYDAETPTPVSSRRRLQQLPEHTATPSPGSACGSSHHGSEPGSEASSRGSSRRTSSAGSRLLSLLGQQRSPAHSGPGNDSKPSGASGMMGLLQRMKPSRSKGRSKSGSSAGGCMAPSVSGDNDCEDSKWGSAAASASKQQQQQHPAWSGCTGGSAVSADDVHLDAEVSSRSAASVAQTPNWTNWTPPMASREAAVAAAAGASAPAASQAAELAAKLRQFQHSALDILQVLQHPSSSLLDDNSTREFERLMTRPGHAVDGDAQARQQQQPQQTASTCSSDSSSKPVVPLPYRVRQEVLQIVHELNAALGDQVPADHA